MKVNVLGTEYEIRRTSKTEYPKLSTLEASGLCELFSKEIIIDAEMNPNNGKEFANFSAFEQKVLRHEIIHAFFHESGLVDYTNDESLVDWIALQFPKMLKAFQEAECI